MCSNTENIKLFWYITKCSICVGSIYRYSQLFSVVAPCHTAGVPSVSDFVPNPMNHSCFNGCTDSVICACSSSHLAGRGGAKTLSMMCPHTESPGVLNQAINVAKLSFHHVQSMMTGSGMPSGSLNENLRTRLKFEMYLTYLLLLVQKLWQQIFV
jgi:hypothetical protein